MTELKTILFAGGGTGGHLFPGIAVAQELRCRYPQIRNVFVGSEREIESAIVSEFQLEHCSLTVEPLPVLKRNPLKFFYRNGQAVFAAKRLIREVNPDAIIGLGGFASAPIVWTAHRSRPIILLEQNVIPGRTNRWLSRYADQVCVTFEQSTCFFPPKTSTQLTGNPVRENIANAAGVNEQRSDPERRPRILILGGSQGADSLNEAMLVAIERIQTELKEWGIIHQTGPRQVDTVRQFYEERGLVADVQAFFHDLPNRYREATIVVSRSGATSIAELTCVGLPMILVPYPHAADNHQMANARALADQDAAIVVAHGTSAEATGAQLASELMALIRDPVKRQSMANAANTFAKPDAASRVVDVIEQAVGKNLTQGR